MNDDTPGHWPYFTVQMPEVGRWRSRRPFLPAQSIDQHASDLPVQQRDIEVWIDRREFGQAARHLDEVWPNADARLPTGRAREQMRDIPLIMRHQRRVESLAPGPRRERGQPTRIAPRSVELRRGHRQHLGWREIRAEQIRRDGAGEEEKIPLRIEPPQRLDDRKKDDVIPELIDLEDRELHRPREW